MSERSTEQIRVVSAIKAAFANKQLPNLEKRRYRVHDVEVGISFRRRGSQRITCDVLYRA